MNPTRTRSHTLEAKIGGKFRRDTSDRITGLIINGDKLSEETLKEVNRLLPKLKHLTFSSGSGKITVDWVDKMNKLLASGKYKEGYILDLSATDVNVDWLKKLREGLDNIDGLNLSHTAIKDGDLGEVNSHSNLKVLYLAQTGVTDTGLGAIKKLDKLSQLYLGKTTVSDDGLMHIKSNHTMLQMLDLSYLVDVTNKGLENLTSLNELKYLDLRYDENVTNDGVPQLEKLKRLKTLGLTGTKVTDKRAKQLGAKLRCEIR